MNEYFPTVVQVIPLDNFHEQVLLHGIFLAKEMSPVTLTGQTCMPVWLWRKQGKVTPL